jgi:hypothetical protein
MTGDFYAFEQAIANVSRIPRNAWLVVLLASGLSALNDLAFWMSGYELNWTWAGPFVALAAVGLAGVYLSTVGIVGKAPTVRGYMRFGLTSIATVLPIGLTIALAILWKPYLSEGARVLALLFGLASSFILASLLVGWPMAQSVSAGLVSPIRIMKATQGHRWSLVLLGFLGASIEGSELVPDISQASNVGEATLIAIADGCIRLFVLGLTAAIAATAWQFAARRDGTLDPS